MPLEYKQELDFVRSFVRVGPIGKASYSYFNKPFLFFFLQSILQSVIRHSEVEGKGAFHEPLEVRFTFVVVKFQKACHHQLEIAKNPAIWLQIIQLNSVSISPKLQLVGFLAEIIIPRYLGLVCKISCYLSGSVFTSPKTRTVREHWAKYLELISQGQVSSFEVEFRGRISSWWRCKL